MSPAPDDRRSLLEGVRALAPGVHEWADEAERARRPPEPLIKALRDAGVFRLCVPSSLGGTEVDVSTLLRVIETVSRADGSAGWTAMIAATSGIVAGYLEEGAAREIYASGPDEILGGVFAPSGRAVAVQDGYRASGRWAFASNCEHCGWLMGGCIVERRGGGRPEARMMLFPASDVSILDTWHASGLRGTGSHDIEVSERFVPESRSVSLVADRPREPGPLYRFPVFGLLALGVSAVALGIARAAIDALVELAGRKTPAFTRTRLAERSATQVDVSRAEAALRSARSLLNETVEEAWEAASERDLTLHHRALLRLAATNAARRSAEAVDLVYEAGGGTSVYAESPLQRCFRDVHTLTQHAAVGPATLELTGRVLLSVDTDTSLL
jgi:alkylation response protein AidB-like acyl-CoA dehydrogenase